MLLMRVEHVIVRPVVKHDRLPSEQNVTWVDNLQIEASLLCLSQLLGMSPAQTSRVLVHTNRCGKCILFMVTTPRRFIPRDKL